MGSLATKNTKSTELWPKVRLGDVCEIEFGTRVRRKDSKGGEYPVYGGGGATFSWPTYNREDCCIVSRFAMSEECVRFVKGKFFLNDSGLSVQAKESDIDQDFLSWCLFAKQPDIYALGRGAAQKNLDMDSFPCLEIPLPPLSVQLEIVARLEKELASVDRMVKGFEEMKAEADQLFKSTLKETFDEIAASGAETRRLGDVCENLDNRRIPITKSDRKVGIYPYFGASGIVDYVNEYIYDGDYLLVSEDGANLLARSTPIAFSVSGKIWVNNHAHILAFADLSTQYYTEYYFASISIAEFVTGAAQPKFTQKALNELIIPLPPLATQREVVAKLDAVREKCAKLKSAAEEGLKTAALMRKAILKEAFE